MDSALEKIDASCGCRHTEEGAALELAWRQRRSHRHHYMRLLKRTVLLVALFWACIRLVSSLVPKVPLDQSPLLEPQLSEFDWDTLATEPELNYKECYNGLQCARLELPMDYWNGTTKATISLAVIRRPARVPITDPSYGGAVLVNPGGPGGSGVSLLLNSGANLQNIVDAPTASDSNDPTTDTHGKNFDIISFDPRGVARSTPGVYCFADQASSESFGLRMMGEGIIGSSDAAFGRLWSMTSAIGQSCSRLIDGPDIKEYVNTASAAHDMLNIVEQHGLWRQREAARVLSTAPSCRQRTSVKSSSPDVPERLKYKNGAEKIQYWGFSYGTYLGATFASLFPDRIERLVIDGVVDAYDYNKGLWSDNLMDTEKDMDSFYDNCARVGYPACALAGHNSTPGDIKDKVANITQSLYHNPLPVVGPNAEVIEYSDVKNLIFGALYSPVQSYPMLANLLAQIEQGDGTEFAKLLQPYHNVECPNIASRGVPTPLRNKTSTVLDNYAGMSIRCGDGDAQDSVNRKAFERFIEDQTELSPTLGPIWATIRMGCLSYSVRPKYRFTGPWVGNTSHPLLLIGNTADPVCPLSSAHKMAQGFAGSVVLTQDSPGHCSVSAYSECTVQYIKTYFQTGALPEPGVVCQADEIPFGSTPGESVQVSAETQEVRRGHKDIAAALFGSGGGFMRNFAGSRIRDGWFE